MKIDSAGITSVRKAGLRMNESLLLGTQKSVRIKRVNFRKNRWTFRRDKRNCPSYPGVRIKRVSVERASTVLNLRNVKSLCLQFIRNEVSYLPIVEKYFSHRFDDDRQCLLLYNPLILVLFFLSPRQKPLSRNLRSAGIERRQKRYWRD